MTVWLPATNRFAYDLNGNLLSDGRRGFDYGDANQLIRVTVTNAWKTEFVYDGKMRRRIKKEFGWQGGASSLTNVDVNGFNHRKVHHCRQSRLAL